MSRSKKNKIRGVILALFCVFVLGLAVIFISNRLIYHYYTNNAEKAVSMAYRGCFTRVENEENSDLEAIEGVYETEEVDYEETEEISWDRVSSESKVEEVIESVETGTYETRMTSFWADDGSGTGECTGSGLCSWDFGVDEHGWYTYNGKLVVATATTYLANQGWSVADGVHLYKYYEELVLTIDGVEYDAIILDSCGSSMKTDRVDLFVSGGWAVKDTMIQVRRK